MLFLKDVSTSWSTRYLDAAVAQLRAEGHETRDEHVARLSPLNDRHANFPGPLGARLSNGQAAGCIQQGSRSDLPGRKVGFPPATFAFFRESRRRLAILIADPFS
ncbi:Tn3 family transposase [Streptomyces sp. SS7]|uniref:Tn3 family transposase n=1 Tax=Streptomyces sp. SS7 TaxID=3108485 RepID=UPI0030EC7212